MNLWPTRHSQVLLGVEASERVQQISQSISWRGSWSCGIVVKKSKKKTLLVRLHVYPAHHGKEGCQCTAPDADCASTTDPQHILCAQHLHTLPFPRQAAGRGLARL